MSEKQPKRTVLSWFLTSGLAVALVMSLVGNWFQYYQTREAQRLSYQFSQIEEFKSSAAELDEVTVELFDLLAEQRDVADAKLRFRSIYRKHVTVTESDRDVLGTDGTERYLQALGVLRNEVEKAKDPMGAGTRVEALAQVISTRRQLNERALDL